MRISAPLLMVVLSGLLCSPGCTGTPTEGGRFSLPTFDAPPQWEPDVPQEPADSPTES